MIAHKILKPSFVRNDKRGLFVEAINGIRCEQIAYGSMIKGAEMGHHYHKLTDLIFFITDGSAKIDFLNVTTEATSTLTVSKNEGVIIQKGYTHVVRFLEDSTFVSGKSRKYDPSDPDTYPLVVPEVKSY
jgi:dTDP-4-dehydrorhamnose 3,5-epimerase-like enzyme